MDHPHVGGNGEETDPTWIGSQTSLREENSGEVYLSNSHLTVGCQRSTTGSGQAQTSAYHMVH